MNLAITPEGTSEYVEWLSTLHPRTCLTVHWLADLGALAEPGLRVRDKALRFARKTRLMESLMTRWNDKLVVKTNAIIENGDLDIYIAYTLWLRYVESIPKRFLLPGGEERVLAYIRTKLRRPELNAIETQRELWWRANCLLEAYGESEDDWLRSLNVATY